MVFALTIGGVSISLEAIGAAITTIGAGLVTISKLEKKIREEKELNENDEKQECYDDQVNNGD